MPQPGQYLQVPSASSRNADEDGQEMEMQVEGGGVRGGEDRGGGGGMEARRSDYQDLDYNCRLHTTWE
jgi:hypothetical protein